MTLLDHTHDPAANSWVEGAADHPEFPVQNLPLGLFSSGTEAKRIGTAIGDFILDLKGLVEAGQWSCGLDGALLESALNAVLQASPKQRRDLRHALFALLTTPSDRGRVAPHLLRMHDCSMHVPAQIGDYTDFYVGIHHANNIGRQFRPDNPLLPNYKYVPIAYHGRASSIRVSGEPVRRPTGQRKPPESSEPIFGPTTRLDYELELGVWIGGRNELGNPVPIDTASERVAGLCILNDWSARDIQAWEYQPLGPFLSKNFHTTVSPWIVTTDALAPFRIPQPPRPEGDPLPLPYLWNDDDQATGAFALTLEVWLRSARMRELRQNAIQLSSGPASSMYWTVAQMVTHHTANGCNLQSGDLLGTGTISGPVPSAYGSLMEIGQGGADRVALPSGEFRSFLEDGDEVSITVKATSPGARTIGFGQCRATVLAQ